MHPPHLRAIELLRTLMRQTSPKRTLHRLLISTLALTSLTLMACSNGETRVESGNRDGIFHVENSAEPQSIDPHVSTGVPENNIILALFEGLVSKDPADLTPVPGIAERWEISEDGKTYLFYIRENARWSDGEPITAHDYVWSWSRSLNPQMANEYAYMLFPLKNAEPYATGKMDNFDEVGVHAISDRILKVELENPTDYFLQLLDHHSTYAVPKHTILKYGSKTDRFSNWTRPGNMVSSGPFLLKEWDIYKVLKVEKNPYYWDKDTVSLNEIHFYPIENFSTAERMFRVGQVHKTFEIPLNKVDVYRKENPETLRNEPYIGTYYYQFNVTKPPFDDVRVRRALSLAIDREAINHSVMFGVVEPAYTLTPPGASGYKPPKLISFDPEEARRLLAEAGYPNGEGFPEVELLYNTNESHRKIAVAVQQMWNENLNLNIQLLNQEWKVYLASRNNLDYDIARAGWIGDIVNPINFLDLGLSSNGNNRSGYNNPAYDELILKTIPESATKEERLANFAKAEEIILNEMPFVPIYTYKTKYLLDPSVKGLTPNFMDYYSYKHVTLGN